MSHCEVDKTTNQMSIVCRLTLCSAGVSIQFDVSVEKGSNKLILCHPKLEEQIEDIRSLIDHDVVLGLNYFYT